MAVIAGIVPELSVDYPPSPPVFLQRGPSRFAVGVDLAQANDWTAVSVIEHKCGVLDRNTELERHCGIGVHPQVKTEFFDVRHIERVRGVSYVDIVARLKSLMMTPPLCGDRRTPPAELIVDATGVGRGVADLISDSGLAFIGVVITGGSVTTHADGNFWHVSKLDLVSRLDGKLHSGALRIAAALGAEPGRGIEKFSPRGFGLGPRDVRGARDRARRFGSELRAPNLVARPAADTADRGRRLLTGPLRLAWHIG